MLVLKRLLGAIVLIVSLVNMSGVAYGAKIAEKAAMQAAMQQYIDGRLIEGAYLHMNMETGDVRRFYPSRAHPMILSMGKYFVLCTDFRDAGDDAVNADFYLARENGRFVVFNVAINDRAMLSRQIDEGKAKRVD